MNFIKRAIQSILFHKINLLISIVIFTIMSSLILCGICIQNACGLSGESLRKTIGASISIDSIMLDDETPKGRNVITYVKAEKLCSNSLVKESNVNAVGTAKSVNFEAFSSKKQTEEYSSSDNIYISGNTSTELDNCFMSGDYSLCGGCFPQNEKDVLVSEKITSINSLKVGDSIEIENSFGTLFTLNICGIYKVNYPITPYGEIYGNKENTLFIPLADAMKINESEKVSHICISISDPLFCDDFVAWAESLAPENYAETGLNYTINDSEYRGVEAALGNTRSISSAMVTISIFMSAVILIMMTIISLRSKEYEAGTLMSMGEGKTKIYFQFLIEQLVPILSSVIIGALISIVFTPKISHLFMSSNGIESKISSNSVILVFTCAILLTLSSSLITFSKLIILKPKTILTSSSM